MPKPDDWKGSDLRSRTDVVRWLRAKGGEIHDPSGLIVGRMRTELGKGRAISQLLADMEADGMLKREVHGRRTLSIKLLDDWGLGDDLAFVPVEQRQAPRSFMEAAGDVDLDLLAQSLLAIVIQRAQAPATGAEAAKLKQELDTLRAERNQLRDDLILAREAEAEQRRQADTMRANLAKLQGAVERLEATPKSGGGSLAERLKPADRKLLQSLVSSLPAKD